MDIYQVLARLKINYNKIDHTAVATAQEAAALENRIEGMGCKNLFLKNNDNQYFLYLLPGDKRADLKSVAQQINSKRLSFASDVELAKYLKLTPGSVSPLGIINDNGSVTILIDNQLVNQLILVHPNINQATLSIKYTDLLLIFDYYGNLYYIIS